MFLAFDAGIGLFLFDRRNTAGSWDICVTGIQKFCQTFSQVVMPIYTSMNNI